MYISIPTWKNNLWSTTDFQTEESFVAFVKSRFKLPGEYRFDKTAFEFNREGRKWSDRGYYCIYPDNSSDWRKYWEFEKEKCRKGAIYHSDTDCWYLPRDFYMFINFLPLYDKVKKDYGIAHVYDSQYHLSLYELLAELHGKHCAIVKKRQWASSYYHCGKLTNYIWFENGVTMKIGASDRRFVSLQGSWEYLELQRSFLNTHTAWYREMNPGGEDGWQQQYDWFEGDKVVKKGNKGRIIPLSLNNNPENGVGGPCAIMFYEEAGISKTLDKTFSSMKSATSQGAFVSTGIFIAAGSVGEMSQCEKLKDMIYHPVENDIYPVESDLLDDKGTKGLTGFFVPEQWSMLPFIDEFGNSLVKEALEALNDLYADWKKTKDPSKYQFEVSQRPRNLAEAFAFRGESEFPVHLLQAQKRRIEENEYPEEWLDIDIDEKGQPIFIESTRSPIRDFPVSKKMEDKRGCCVVFERPVKDPPFGAYYGSVDPVEKGKTRESESLCSIYIYKTAFELRTTNAQGEVEAVAQTPGMVAAWCGRFDNPDDTHRYLERLIEMYNAWTTVEENVSGFITWMIGKHKQKHLVPKNQMIFRKDLSANHDDSGYGWRNVGNVFRDNMLQYAKNHMLKVLEEERSHDGLKVMRQVLGITEIKDIMLIKEMEQYRAGLNVDRLVTWVALIVFVTLQEANRASVIVDRTKESSNNKAVFTKLQPSPFRHVGGNSKVTKTMRKSPFKNIR